MALPYSPSTWVDNVTQFTASVGNRFEQALKDLSDAVTSLQSSIPAGGSYAPLASPNITGDMTVNGTLKVNGSDVALVPVSGAVRVRKANAGTRSTTTLTADSDLIIPIGANEEWDIAFFVGFTGDVGNDFKMAISGPTGATVLGSVVGHGTGVTGATGTAQNRYTVNAFGSTTPVYSFGALGTSTPNHCEVRLTVINGSTAGSVALYTAKDQNTVTTTDTTILAMSTGVGVRAS